MGNTCSKLQETETVTFQIVDVRVLFSCREKLSSGKTVAMQLASRVAEIQLSSTTNKIQMR